jgi:hypothetical protein
MTNNTTDTASSLIARSTSHSEVAHAEWSADLAADLAAECDDSTEASATVLEFWGVDDDGVEWRVHLDGARQASDTDNTEYHVTAVRDGAVYGHLTTCCDAGGCAGHEDLICLAADAPGVAAGSVVELDTWTLASDAGQECVEAVSAAAACRKLLRSAGQHRRAGASSDPVVDLQDWLEANGGRGTLLDSDGAPVWRVA